MIRARMAPASSEERVRSGEPTVRRNETLLVFSGRGGPEYWRTYSMDSRRSPANPATLFAQVRHQLPRACYHGKIELAGRITAKRSVGPVAGAELLDVRQIEIENRRAPFDQARMNLEQAADRLTPPHEHPHCAPDVRKALAAAGQTSAPGTKHSADRFKSNKLVSASSLL